MADPPPYPGMPRWVKVFGIVVLVLVLLFVARMFIGGGEHGPGRHGPSGSAGSQGLTSGVMQDHSPPEGGRG